MQEPGPWEREEGLDGFSSGHGLIGQETGCTFCGSLPGDRFMELLRAGKELEPTDKDYKAYVRDGDKTVGKFYYQHLSQDQKLEFIDLVNSRRLAIGYPGYLYVTPFFMTWEREGS